MPLALLCPGQGAQSPADSASLCRHPAARAVLEEASTLLDVDLSTLSLDDLHTNAIAQPVLCALALAGFRALGEAVSTPALFLGYSVGELAAYGCAGSLDLPTLLQLARLRAKLMDAASSTAGTLLAVRALGIPTLKALCVEHACAIAIINAPDKTIVGGARANLAALAERCEMLGAKTTPLPIAIASHTSAMARAVAPFAAALRAASFKIPSAPVLAGIDARAVTSHADMVATLSAQLASTIRFDLCLERLHERGITVALELLPGDGLSRMLREHGDMRGDHAPIATRALGAFRTFAGAADFVARAL